MNNVSFCPKCGQALAAGTKFCTNCGFNVSDMHVTAAPNQQQSQAARPTQNLFDSATEKLNSWTGEQKKVPIHLGTMFSEVFKSHSETEAEALFIVGTSQTTPTLAQVSDSPVKPWLFSRVLALFILTISLLVGSLYVLNGQKMYVGLISISSLAVPFSLLIMFFEINTFKNISIFKVTKIFMVGGVASLLATLGLYQFVEIGQMSIVTAAVVAVIEETGKLIMIAYYINRINTKFILNGMLIGAAIGAGFATFETAGYAGELGVSVLLLRGVTALGTHTLWCAIVGAALALAKGSAPLSTSVFQNGRFIRFFLLSIALHATWDAPLSFNMEKYTILIIIAWVIILVLIDAGLREIKTLQQGQAD
ncbi:PrsW family intramembrane metalloprotease [Lactobacillus sp. CBA3606]|uniref:PrsW family intramembrane metalloprotease n=1 Tax=Lactobacillus sp. CBA3606 TaxID=2099789 RepID=UPI001F2A99D6|nr:PrsW family intramembrane metalloprotease [Lactobacillus sp. CBA3606]